MKWGKTWSVLLAVSMTLPALAQDDELEEVLVTGSYVARQADRPQPITILDSVSIDNEQRLTVGEIFRDLNVTQGNFNGMNAFGENATSPASAVNLRGLGPRATLTLLNGHRQTIDGSQQSAWVDINSLTPSIMIDRVEVLTDGASALYGSDAVAGVVNLITRNDFEGVEIDYSSSQVDRSGAVNSTLGLLFGAQSERSGVVFGLDYTDRPEVLSQEIFNLDRIQKIRALPFSNPPSLQPGAGGMARRIPDPLCEDPSVGGPEIGGVDLSGTIGGCGYRLSLDRSIVSEAKRATGLGVATHDFGGGITGQLELGFSTIDTSRILNSVPVNDPTRPVLQVGHPGLAHEIANGNLANRPHRVWFRIRKPEDEFDARETQNSNHYRLASSLNGAINESWDWQVTGTLSRNRMLLQNRDYIHDRVDDALLGYGGSACNHSSGGASGYGRDAIPGTADDGSIDTNCMWFNPLANNYLASPGDPRYNSPEVKDFIYVIQQTEGAATLRTLEFLVTGNPADWIGVAVGAQSRDQDFGIDFDPITEVGGYVFRDEAQLDYNGDIGSDALFAEAVLFPTDDLEIQFAARNEEYDNGRGSTDPKFGLLWTPTDNLYIRATAGTSFRIANPTQFFGIGMAGGISFEIDGEDPVAGTLIKGSPDLEPEEADTLTMGLTWDVTDSLTLDLNYWSIDFTNIIVQESANIIIRADAADGIISDPRIKLSPTVTNPCVRETSPGSGTYTACGDLTTNEIIGFEISYFNDAFLNTDGVDLGIDYRFESGPNNFGLRLNATQTLSYEIPGVGGIVDGVGSLNHTNNGDPAAATKASLRFSWARGNHFAQITARHTSALDQDVLSELPDSTVFDYNIFDLAYRYSTELAGNSLDLTAGVVNVADTEAPIDGDNISSYVGQIYDARGRMIRIGATMSFGQ